MNNLKNTTGTFPTLGKVEERRPTADWTVEQLGEYAKAQEEICIGLGRKMAVHRFREGSALTLAQKKVGYGGWGDFLKRHGISHSSDDRARKLFERARNEKNLEGLTIMDAYESLGIEQRQGQAKAVTNPSAKSATALKPPSQHKSTSAPRPPEPPRSPEPPKPSIQEKSNIEEAPVPQEGPSQQDVPSEEDDHDATDEVDGVLELFDRIVEERGWDDDRKAEVVARLASPDSVKDLIGAAVKTKSVDEVIDKLCDFAMEGDYFSWLLAKVIRVAQEVEVTDKTLPLVDQTIAELEKVRKAMLETEQAA